MSSSSRSTAAHVGDVVKYYNSVGGISTMTIRPTTDEFTVRVDKDMWVHHIGGPAMYSTRPGAAIYFIHGKNYNSKDYASLINNTHPDNLKDVQDLKGLF